MRYKLIILFLFAFGGAFAFPAMEPDTIGPNETKINNIQPKSPAAPDWMLSTATNGKLKWVRSTRWQTGISSTPAPVAGWGNPTALFGRFVEMPDGNVWYVDYVGFGRKISVRPTPADRDWLEVTARTIPDSIGDAIFTYNYASIGANYKWPGAELLVNDSTNYGVGIVQGNREARWGVYNSVLGTWADFQINGAQSQVALGPGVTDYTVMTAAGTVQQPSIPFSTLFNINTVSQNVTIPYYPNTRDDASTPTNFLYTNSAGAIQSGPLTEVIKPEVLLGNGPFTGPCNGYSIAVDTLGFDTAYYCNNGVWEETYQSRMVAPIKEGRYVSTFGDSYTTGVGATIPQFIYTNRFATTWGLTVNNQAVSGRGVYEAAKRANQYMPLNHNYYVTMLAGLNDLRRAGGDTLTLKKIQTCTRVVLANAYLKTAVPGSLLPGTGTWGVYAGTSAYMGGKAAYIGGEAAYGDVDGMTKTFTFTGPNVVIGTFAADGINFTFGKILVTIDGQPHGEIDFNGYTDGVYDGSYDNKRVSAVKVYTGLSNTPHNITLTLANCIAITRPVYIDYIGTLKDPDHSSTAIVMGPPHLPPAGWAITAPYGSDAAADAAYMAMVEACKSFGQYPVVSTPACIDYSGFDVDNVHPNNEGHRQLAACMTNALYTGSILQNSTTSSSSSVAIGPFQTATNSNGLSLTGSAISLHAASASTPGGVSVVQQTFGAGTGNKVFSSDNALQVKCDDVSGSKSAGIGFSELGNTVALGNITVGGDATNSTMTMRIQDATNSTAYITIGSLNDNNGVKEKGGLYEDVKAVSTFPYTVIYGDRNIVYSPLNVGDNTILQKIGSSTGETKIGRVLYLHNIGTQSLTVNPAAGDTIDGQVNQALGVNKSMRLVAISATNWAMNREF